MNLNGKKIWITGASSGIGLALSKQLAEQGAQLVLSARRQDVLETVAQSLDGEGHYIVPLDLSQSDNIVPEVSAALEDVGPIDILINNAGISQRSLFVDTQLSVFREIMEINYFGTVAMTQALLPGMLERGSGSIVNISSVAGKVGSKLRSSYSGSKYAVIGFMDCLRAEVSLQGIHCMTVCPGFIQTNIDLNARTGDGSAHNQKEEAILNGMNVESCARDIIKALKAEKDEVVIGSGMPAIAPFLKRLSPALVNWVAARKTYR